MHQHTEEYYFRSSYFFESLTSIVDSLNQLDLVSMEPEIKELLGDMSTLILKREIKEKNTQDTDYLLAGKMKLIKALI